MQGVSEIYRLRKDGQIEDAYKKSVGLYESNKDNIDVKKALAWVLVSLCEKLVGNNDLASAKEKFDLLDSLNMQGGDKYSDILVRKIDFYRRMLSVWGRLNKMSRDGLERDAYCEARALVSSNMLQEDAMTYGWILYRFLKKEMNSIPIAEMERILLEYMLLPIERPSLLHSCILMLAENYKGDKKNDSFDFLNFFKKWGPQYLRCEDFVVESKEINNRTVTFRSIGAKAMSLCFDAVRRSKNKEDIEWLLPIYKGYIEKSNDRWTQRELALLYLFLNDRDEAYKIYRQLLRMPSPEYYLWYEAACCELDMNIRAGLLSKALTIMRKEEFIGGVRLAMADTLLRLQKPEAASIELGKYYALYDSHKWHINAKYEELVNRLNNAGVSLGNPKLNNIELYRQYLPKALEFVYSDFDYEHAVVDNVNKEKRVFHVVSASGKSSVVKFCESDICPHLGCILRVKYLKRVDRKDDSSVSWKAICMVLDKSGNDHGLKKQFTSGYLKVSMGAKGLYGIFKSGNFSAYVPAYILKSKSYKPGPYVLTDDSIAAVLSGFPEKWTVIEIGNK